MSASTPAKTTGNGSPGLRSGLGAREWVLSAALHAVVLGGFVSLLPPQTSEAPPAPGRKEKPDAAAALPSESLRDPARVAEAVRSIEEHQSESAARTVSELLAEEHRLDKLLEEQALLLKKEAEKAAAEAVQVAVEALKPIPAAQEEAGRKRQRQADLLKAVADKAAALEQNPASHQETLAAEAEEEKLDAATAQGGKEIAAAQAKALQALRLETPPDAAALAAQQAASDAQAAADAAAQRAAAARKQIAKTLSDLAATVAARDASRAAADQAAAAMSQAQSQAVSQAQASSQGPTPPPAAPPSPQLQADLDPKQQAAQRAADAAAQARQRLDAALRDTAAADEGARAAEENAARQQAAALERLNASANANAAAASRQTEAGGDGAAAQASALPYPAPAPALPPAPDLAAGELQGKNLAELFQLARQTEARITKKYQAFRAAELAAIRHIPLDEALRSMQMARPEREPLDLGLLAAQGAGADPDAFLSFKDQVAKAGLQLSAMSVLGHSLLANAEAQEKTARGEIDASTFQTLSGAYDRMVGAATADDRMPGRDLTGMTSGDGKGTAAGQPGLIPSFGRAAPELPSMDYAHLKPLASRRIGAPGGRPSDWVYVDSWYLIGPFPNPGRQNLNTRFPPESVVDLSAVYPGKNGVPIGWKFIQWTSPKLQIPHDVEEAPAIYYAYTELLFDRPLDLWIVSGSDDKGTMWLNDVMVWNSNDVFKSWTPNEGYRKVHFNAGRNRVLYRLENGQAAAVFSLMISMRPGGAAPQR